MTGQVTINGTTYEDAFEFYVRDEKRVVNSFFTRLGERLRAKGLLRSADLGDSAVPASTWEAVFREPLSAMQEDPFYLLRDPAVPDG